MEAMPRTPCSTLDDGLGWRTFHSRSRCSSAEGLNLNIDSSIYETVSNFQSLLDAFHTCRIRQIPHEELEEINYVREGSVFTLREHNWKGRVVAVKHVKRNLLDTSDTGLVRRQLRSILQELLVTLHGPIAGHPNIIHAIGFGWRVEHEGPLPYTVVEYGSMGSLRQFLTCQNPSTPIKYKMILAGDVLAGLMALHQSRIVHGDLKLDKVVLSPALDRPCGCIAKICDFGSSIITATKAKTVEYQGTLLYLPPEAIHQEDEPIPRGRLEKCDVWAYGLALWEILIDGQCYFRNAWRRDTKYSRTTSKRSLSRCGCCSSLRKPPRDSSQIHPSPTSKSINLLLGDFDLCHLQKLAQEDLSNVCATHTWERSCLARLLGKTLEPCPNQRGTQLNKSPIMLNWCYTVPESALQANIAMHTPATDDAIDLFCPARQKYVLWEHQVQLMQSLQSMVDNGRENQRVASAAFRLMTCHALGFGCEVNLKKAAKCLQKAVALRLSVALLFGDLLANGFGARLPMKSNGYSEKVITGFSLQRSVTKMSPWYLYTSAGPNDPTLQLDSVPMVKLRASSLLKAAMKLPFKTKDAILADTSLYCSTSQMTFTWPEIAILTGDLSLLQSCCKRLSLSQLDNPGCWGETLPILACHKGRAEMLLLLLNKGLDPSNSVHGNCNILHWLFGLGENAVSILDLLVSCFSSKRCLEDKINEVCTSVYRVDARWPIEMTGTPLAFAVVSGNHALVKRLLTYGADPLALFELSSSPGNRPISWTAIHLAVKYNFPEMVRDFCAHVSNRPWPWPELSSHLRFPDFQLAAALSLLTPIERHSIHGHLSQTCLLETIKALPTRALRWPSIDGRTPLWLAIDHENTEVVQSLLNVHPRLALLEALDPGVPGLYIYPFNYAAYVCAHRGSQDATRILELLLSAQGDSLPPPDSDGITALHEAVLTQFTPVAEWIISKSFDVNATDSLGHTPLMLCRSASHTTLLLKHDARTDLVDTSGLNAAHHMVSRGLIESLQILVDHGVNLNQVAQTWGTTLHVAAVNASGAFVEQLCKAGARVNLPNLDGDTPLHLAIASKRGRIAEMLLRCDADPTMMNHQSQRPTSLAIQQIGSRSMSEASNEFRVLKTLLHAPCLAGRDNQQSMLLVHSLHEAAEAGGFEVVKCILDQAATQMVPYVNADAVWEGRRPFHTAAYFGKVEAAKMLRDQGADPHKLDSHGSDALMILCSSKCSDDDKLRFCDLLLSYKPDLNMKNKKGQTAWMVARAGENFTIMGRLLDAVPEADMDRMLRSGPITWRLIDTALSVGHVRFVRVCLRYSKYVHFLNDEGVMEVIARSLGCEKRHKTIVSKLKGLITHHSDLVQDVMHGKPVLQRLLARNILSDGNTSLGRAGRSNTGVSEDAVREQNAKPHEWVSRPIQGYFRRTAHIESQ